MFGEVPGNWTLIITSADVSTVLGMMCSLSSVLGIVCVSVSSVLGIFFTAAVCLCF